MQIRPDGTPGRVAETTVDRSEPTSSPTTNDSPNTTQATVDSVDARSPVRPPAVSAAPFSPVPASPAATALATREAVVAQAQNRSLPAPRPIDWDNIPDGGEDIRPTRHEVEEAPDNIKTDFIEGEDQSEWPADTIRLYPLSEADLENGHPLNVYYSGRPPAVRIVPSLSPQLAADFGLGEEAVGQPFAAINMGAQLPLRENVNIFGIDQRP